MRVAGGQFLQAITLLCKVLAKYCDCVTRYHYLLNVVVIMEGNIVYHACMSLADI